MMSFVSHFQADTQNLPASLGAVAIAALTKLDERSGAQSQTIFDDPDLGASFVRILVCSPFVLESLIKSPTLIVDPVFKTALLFDRHRDTYQHTLAALTMVDEAGLMRDLRLFRRREMVRIAWRDLAGWATLDETLNDLSQLAEACIQFALAFIYKQQCESKGVPTLADGTPFNLVVLGMGKLGAYELNYSSDIDLIFAFAEHGTLKDRLETSYQEFFSRIVRSLIKVLDAITEDGFVFRTDIRLRPFGDSGPLIMTFDGMEHYYQTQAREWERYAMVKVRQVAGDFNTGATLMAMFKPFVYRRYLDYGAIADLRSLKLKIAQELHRKDRLDNIKLGFGGIREIEFMGQVFQLIRGGQVPVLQQRGILEVLKTLAKLQLLASEEAAFLQTAYVFLRKVENHIQAYQDQQTHDLPKDAAVQAVLAYSMDYDNWADFEAALDLIREQVHSLFNQVFAVSKLDAIPSIAVNVWTESVDETLILTALADLGFQDAAEVLKILRQFKHSTALKRLTAKGVGVIERLLPQLLINIGQVTNTDVTFKRLLNLFEAVAGRTVYLSLLEENVDALIQIIKLSSASPWICEYLAQYPALFDELLDTRSLYEPLQKQALKQSLQLQMQNYNAQDLEQVMIGLRFFKHTCVLKVAAADIMGVIPVMVVSDYLTYIAETIVDYVLDYAWMNLTQKHGLPPNTQATVTDFGIIGYGKLGGFELSYSSDLDLVFIYNCPDGLAMTQGNNAITCAQFYGRLGQQVRHILDTRMLSGVLYAVDLRLRPNGDSGLLVTHVQAYAQYLNNNAWTWEHQALVRARFIAGDDLLKQQFVDIREVILTLPRDLEALKASVREMREKMRTALIENAPGKFDLKHSRGGIADIEFMVQYGVLAAASSYPYVTTYTDNVRILDGLQTAGFMSKSHADTLKAAYCRYRDYGHKLVLQGEPTLIASTEVADIQLAVEQIWQLMMVA